jgi:hypothetical protein
MRFVRSLWWTFLAVLGLAVAAQAQPFVEHMYLIGPEDAYVEVPSTPELNPGKITIELFVDRRDSSDSCRTLLGKGYTTSYWIGICGRTLRSFLAGPSSLRDGGTVGVGIHHIAVTYDGAWRKHYVDGELVAVFPERRILPRNTRPLRIGADIDYPHHSIRGRIFEVRLWRVARTQAQLQDNINFPISSSPPGLVALWHMNDDATDALGRHDAVSEGGLVFFLAFCPGCGGYDCTEWSTVACLLGGQFMVQGEWTEYSPPAADGHVTPRGSGTMHRLSGGTTEARFWFSSPASSDLLVGGTDACPSDGHWWMYTETTTHAHYQLRVLDELSGYLHLYFKFAGPPGPPMIDHSAFPCF